MKRMWKVVAGLCVLAVVGCGRSTAEEGSELSAAPTHTSSSNTTTTVSVSSEADNMRAWADIVKAQAAYLTAQGDFNLKSAEAEFKLALAAQEWIKAQKLDLEVKRLKIELFKLQQAEYKAGQKAKNIEEKAKAVNPMIIGIVTPLNIQALEWLQMNAIPTETTIEVMTQPVPAIAPSNFKGVNAATANGFAGGNVGQYFQFLKATKAGVEPYSEAHLPILLAVEKFSTKAKEGLAAVQLQLQILAATSPFAE